MFSNEGQTRSVIKGNRRLKSKRPVPDVWRPAAVFDGYGR